MDLTTKSALPEGVVVVTANQTAGRGQRGNVWKTEPNSNLTFSLLLKPSFLQARNQFRITIATSLGIIDFLKERKFSEPKIKWPNDIILSNKKVCGVLIENSLQGENISQSIVGIGMNVNQKEFSLPSASSLSNIFGQDLDLNEALNSLIENLEKRYLQLRAGKTDEMKSDYLQNLLGFQQTRLFESKEKNFEGTITDVNESGELIVNSESQSLSFNLKEISFIL